MVADIGELVKDYCVCIALRTRDIETCPLPALAVIGEAFSVELMLPARSLSGSCLVGECFEVGETVLNIDGLRPGIGISRVNGVNIGLRLVLESMGDW